MNYNLFYIYYLKSDLLIYRKILRYLRKWDRGKYMCTNLFYKMVTVMSGIETNNYAEFVELGAKELLEISEKSLACLNYSQIVHHRVTGAHSRSETGRAEFHSLQKSRRELFLVLVRDQLLDFTFGVRILFNIYTEIIDLSRIWKNKDNFIYCQPDPTRAIRLFSPGDSCQSF